MAAKVYETLFLNFLRGFCTFQVLSHRRCWTMTVGKCGEGHPRDKVMERLDKINCDDVISWHAPEWRSFSR